MYTRLKYSTYYHLIKSSGRFIIWNDSSRLGQRRAGNDRITINIFATNILNDGTIPNFRVWILFSHLP